MRQLVALGFAALAFIGCGEAVTQNDDCYKLVDLANRMHAADCDYPDANWVQPKDCGEELAKVRGKLQPPAQPGTAEARCQESLSEALKALSSDSP